MGSTSVRYFMRADFFYRPEFPEIPVRTLARVDDFARVHTVACLEDFQVGREAPRKVDNLPSISVPVALEDLPRGLRISVRCLRADPHSDGYFSVILSDTVTLRNPPVPSPKPYT